MCGGTMCPSGSEWTNVADVSGDTGGLHFEMHGHGPTLMLTHGFGATSRMWDEQIEEFTSAYRMILWDLPAHGRSPDVDADPDRLIAHMRSVLEAEKAAPAVLIGLGVGGLLSLRFWRKYPTLVRGLILIGVMPGLRGPAARTIWNGQIEAQARALEEGGLAALEGGAEADPEMHENAAALARVARTLLIQKDDGALGWLAEVNVPVLILVGGKDKPHLTTADFMARTIPGARKEVIFHGNHAATLHRPQVANAAIRDFLARLPP